MMNQLLDMDYNLRYMTERYLTNKKRRKKNKRYPKEHPIPYQDSITDPCTDHSRTSGKRHPGNITQDGIKKHRRNIATQ
jgi:hypothetical protein